MKISGASAAQSDIAIERQPLRAEGNALPVCSGLQSPALQWTPGKLPATVPRTMDGSEIVRFCAFAPPRLPLDRT